MVLVNLVPVALNSPIKDLIREDLPAPFGPMIPIISPRTGTSLIKSLIGEFNATGTKLLYNKPIQQQLQHITYIPQKAHIDKGRFTSTIRAHDTNYFAAYWYR
jgi:hypothetical protein